MVWLAGAVLILIVAVWLQDRAVRRIEYRIGCLSARVAIFESFARQYHYENDALSKRLTAIEEHTAKQSKPVRKRSKR